MYFGIPSKIVNHLNLDQDDYLLVDVTDNLIVIKKHNPQFTKIELNKISLHQNNDSKKSIVLEEKKETEEEFVNLLDGIDL